MGFWGRLYSKIRKALTPVVRRIKNGLSFCLNKLSTTARALVDFAREHPYRFGFYSVLIIGGIVIIALPPILGFTAGGIAAGSAAAAAHATIGNVVAGSFFAILQSVTMTGVLTAIGTAAVTVGLTALIVDFLKWWNGRGNDSGGGPTSEKDS